MSTYVYLIITKLMFRCSPIGLYLKIAQHLEIAQPSITPRNPGKPGSSGNMPKLTLIVLPSINSIPPNMEYPVEFSVVCWPHRALLEKLKQLNLNPVLTRWFCSYLMKREQDKKWWWMASHLIPYPLTPEYFRDLS